MKMYVDMAEKIRTLLDQERDSGVAMTATIEAAVYWYITQLNGEERELARRQCAEWIKSGNPPPVLDPAQVEAHREGVRDLLNRASAQAHPRGQRATRRRKGEVA